MTMMTHRGMGTAAIRGVAELADAADTAEFEDGVASVIVLLRAAKLMGPGRAINVLHHAFGVVVTDENVEAANEADIADAAGAVDLADQIVRSR